MDRAKKRVGRLYRKAYSVHYGVGTLILERSNDMTDVTFTNSRADSSANEDLTTLARHGADAFGYKAEVPPRSRRHQL